MSYFHFLAVDGPSVQRASKGPEGSVVAARNGDWCGKEQGHGEGLQTEPAGLRGTAHSSDSPAGGKQGKETYSKELKESLES